MNILSKSVRVVCVGIPFCLLTVVAVAGDDSASGADAGSGEYFRLEKCIRTTQIRRTDILDDRTIIFYMRQKKIFMNQLPRRCAGLKIAGTFAYRSYASRLCDIDTIRVIRSMSGQPDSGPSCGLGMFRPVSEEEVAMIRNREVEIPPQEPAADESTSE